MAKLNINFNNTNYEIDESVVAEATTALQVHLSTTMAGSGATINLGGVAYNIDSTKLSTATNNFVSHLGTISGNGSKVKVNGVEYSIGSDKVSDALGELEAVLGGLNNPNEPTPTDERLEGDGAEFHKFAPAALTFRSTAPLNELQEVQINGVTVDPSNYTLEEGSTIVTFPIDYLNTLDVGSYEVAVASQGKTVKGDFSVKASEINNHGFYYNQPYMAYVDYFGENESFFIREGGVLDVVGTPSGELSQCTYTVDGSTMTVVSPVIGTLTATISADGKAIYCNELATNFTLGNDAIVADEDYIYIYKEDLGGYEVNAIDKTKVEYGDIKTGINGIDTVKLADYAFMKIEEGIWIGSNMIHTPSIPNTVTTIGNYAFNQCTSLEGISFSDNITSIGSYAFHGCTSLKHAPLSNSITSIGHGAFWGCTNLISVTIPNSITSISPSAFDGCSSLVGVNIPDGVTSIGGFAFANCKVCTHIGFLGTIAQWNSITKDASWNQGTPATYVQCSDGQVAL